MQDKDEALKNVVLDPPGEPPRWGMGGASNPLDRQIVAAKDQSFEEQQTLFEQFARHLFASQARGDKDLHLDHSDDPQWLANLATWFRWTDEQRDAAISSAAQAEFAVFDYEIDDATHSDQDSS
jgi:hypothetical protein